MGDERKNILVVGLAEAGKTSYILALDELLEDPPDAEALRSTGLAYDRTYLETLKPGFRAGLPIDRTRRREGPPVELWFKVPETEQTGRLLLPDLDGEVYRDQWVNRYWTGAFETALQDACGMLLFVRADQPSTNAELLGELIKANVPAGRVQPWDPMKASAQVQLVDVLQFVAAKGSLQRPLKIAVILSAWDTWAKMGAQAPTPVDFFRRDWALLAQYTAANPDIFSARVYGVSALGGTVEEMQELAAAKPPVERVMIVDGPDVSRDLSRPLRWILSN